MKTQTLTDEADRLRKTLQDAAYLRLCCYSQLPYYDRRCETDPYVLRLNVLCGRAMRRLLRRMNAKGAA